MNKKLILLPVVAMMLVGCGSKKPDPDPVPTPEPPAPTEETADAVVTAAVGGYTDEGTDPGYLAEPEAPVAVDVLTVTYEQLGFYGHDYNTGDLLEAGGWLQFRSKNGGSKLFIESSKPIKSVKIVLPDTKDAYDNTNCWDAKFGTDATYGVETIGVDTVAGQKEYTITPSANTNKFFALVNGTETHTHYAKSVTITYIK